MAGVTVDSVAILDGSRRLVVRGNTFPIRAHLGSVGGLRWEQRLRAWAGPATPSLAGALDSTLRRSGQEAAWVGCAEYLRYAARIEAENLEAVRRFQDVELPDPAGDPRRPRWQHQRAAFAAFGEASRGLLYMGMGTGKTFTALDLLAAARPERVLVIAPKATILGVWPGQISEHGWRCRVAAVVSERTDVDPDWTVPVEVLNGTTAAKAKKLGAWLGQSTEVPSVVLINYETVWRKGMAELILSTPWDVGICDEIQRAKSPGGKASRFLARLAGRVPRRFGLSGTPCPHSPLDAYGVFRWLDAGIFGTNFAEFRARYAILGGYEGRQVVGYQNEPEFNRRFYSITFRADTEDVLDLPEKHHVERVFDMPPSALKVYRDLAEEFVAFLTSPATLVTAQNALSKVGKLQQIACGFVHDDDGLWQEIHTARREALEEILDEIDPAEPVVAFCRFVRDYDAVHLAAEKSGRRSFELTGRRDELREWKADVGGSVLVASGQSAAEGIDLTRACYVVFYSHGTSLGQYEQACARAHRPGQTRRTTFLHLVARKTVDRKLIAAHRSKKEVLDLVLADPRWLL